MYGSVGGLPNDSETEGLNEILPGNTAAHHLLALAVSMLAVGGTIGTGLFFLISSILQHGPLAALAGIFYVAFLVVIVLEVSAEMAVFLPKNGSICISQFVFLGPAVGLANNLIYWASWCLTFALELSILVSLCRFWNESWTNDHQSMVVVITWTILTVFNLLPVDIYGEIEFWIAVVKVVALLLWIVFVSLVLVILGQGISGWTSRWPESFTGDLELLPNSAVTFLGCLIYASFVFQSVESVAITAGDVLTPEKTMPRVVRVVFVRIVVFYLATVVLLTLSVPFDDPRLPGSLSSNLLSSPFLIALLQLGYGELSWLLNTANAIIFSAILSAANLNVYFGSRCLAAIAEDHGRKSSFSFLATTNREGVPVAAVLVTSLFGLVALFLRYKSIAVIFEFLLTACASAGMLMWCLLCFSHVNFIRAFEKQGMSRNVLKLQSSWNLRLWLPFAAWNFVGILMLNGLTTYWDFSWLRFWGSYMTPTAFLLCWGTLRFCGFGGLPDLELVDLSEGNTY